MSDRCQISAAGQERPHRATTASQLHQFRFGDAFKCRYADPAQQLLGDATMRLHRYEFSECFKAQQLHRQSALHTVLHLIWITGTNNPCFLAVEFP